MLTFAQTHAHTCECLHTYRCIHINTHACTRMHSHTHTRLTCVCIHTHMCTHKHMDVCMHIHTQRMCAHAPTRCLLFRIFGKNRAWEESDLKRELSKRSTVAFLCHVPPDLPPDQPLQPQKLKQLRKSQSKAQHNPANHTVINWATCTGFLAGVSKKRTMLSVNAFHI